MTIIGLFSGSVMYSYFIPKYFKHINIKENSEDGNPGSSNAIAASGAPIGIICLILDVFKAFIPVYISVSILNISGLYLVPIMIAPVLGHAFSPFLKFKGGKAVASSYGALLGSFTISGAVLVFVIVMAIFQFIIVINPNSTRVIAAFAIASILIIIFGNIFEIKLASFIISVVVCSKHLLNPNKGEFGVFIWRYGFSIKNKKLQFARR